MKVILLYLISCLGRLIVPVGRRGGEGLKDGKGEFGRVKGVSLNGMVGRL